MALRVALEGCNCAVYFRGGRRADASRDRCAYLDLSGVYTHVNIYLMPNKCVQIYVSSKLNTSFKVFFLVSDLFVIDNETFFSSQRILYGYTALVLSFFCVDFHFLLVLFSLNFESFIKH